MMGGLFIFPFIGLGLLILAFPVLLLALLALTLGLRRRVRRLEARLHALEGGEAAVAPPAGPIEPVPPAGPVAEPPVPAAGPRVPEPVPVAPAVETPSLSAPVEAAPRAPRDGGIGQLEGRLGGTWLNRVGALLLVLGIGFFLKYAFENEWVGPAGRVTIGLLIGLTGLLLGERLQRAAYRVPAQGLAAAGVAVLYLSGYAAHGFYQLVTAPAAFAFLVLATATGMAVAVRHDARAIAVLASLGGFLVPLLLSTGTDAAGVLFTYLAILDVGILAAAAWRGWGGLEILAFAATQFLYWGWLDHWYRPERLGVALVAASGFFALFALTGLLAAPRATPEAPTRRGWLGPALLILAAPTLYFLEARRILTAEPPPWLALLCLVLATAYLLAGQWTLHARAAPILALLHLCLAVTFVTLAFAVRFSNHALAIAWSAEGLALLWGGHRLDARMLRLGAFGVLALAWVRWFTLLSDTGQPGWFLVAHPAFPATLGVALSAALAALLYRVRERAEPRPSGLEAAAGPVLVLVAVGSLAALVSVELGQFRTLAIPPPYVRVMTIVVWMIAALPWLALARRDPTRLLLGAVTVLLVVLGAMSVDEAPRWERLVAELRPAVLNPRFLAALLLAVLYWLYGRVVPDSPHLAERTRTRLGHVATAGAALLLLWNLSMEVTLMPLPGFPGLEAGKVRGAGLSVLWTLYAFAAMGIGMWRRRAALRIGAIALFGVTVAKVFAVDLAGLDAIYRIFSFLILGVVLLLASFLYARYRRRPAGAAP